MGKDFRKTVVTLVELEQASASLVYNFSNTNLLEEGGFRVLLYSSHSNMDTELELDKLSCQVLSL